MIMHFKTQKERLDYLKGGYEEIVLEKVNEEPKQSKSDNEKSKNDKKTQKSASKSKKETKEEEKDGKAKAE